MMQTDDIKMIANQSSRKIERREWRLWYLSLVLILFLGSLSAATYLFLLGDSIQEAGIPEDTARAALSGLFILITLFCAYVLHTRITLGSMKQIIQKQATLDHLTHLHNRHYFDEQIEEELVRANRKQSNLALLIADLTGFKAINDAHGRQGGDETLKMVARSIQEATRGTDLVFRWGGDEFAVILLDITREGIHIAVERIRKGIQKIAKERRAELDLNVGVAIYPEHGKNPDELIRLAERALHIAKEAGDHLHIGEEEYHINDQTIRIVFQPVVDVWSNQIMGYEALGRDPQGKLSILELFQKYKIIGRLDELKRVCFWSQFKTAQEIGIRRLFVNITFEVLSQLEAKPKPPGMEVILEISEAEVLHDIENHLEVVTRWRQLGYQFAIDDFGAGFISLPFIARLLPDYIKLDRSTILHAVASVQFKAFLKKLIPVLQTYAIEGIIAEGIENSRELEVTKELGVFLVQGFLLGKPQ